VSPRLVAVASIVALVAAVSISGSNADNPPPLFGVTFTHSTVEPSTCNFSATRTGIVDTYHLPGVRRLVRAQLASMKASGIDAIRILNRHIKHVHIKDAVSSSQPRMQWGEEVPFGYVQGDALEDIDPFVAAKVDLVQIPD